MAGVTISSLSTQFVQVPLRAFVGGAAYNPTADTVAMAFIAGWAKPTALQWNTAQWAWTTAVNGYYAAECLIGPLNGGVPLAVGTYNVWLRVTDSPEVPSIVCGTLTIT
jgi:hypothetical protein